MKEYSEIIDIYKFFDKKNIPFFLILNFIKDQYKWNRKFDFF